MPYNKNKANNTRRRVFEIKYADKDIGQEYGYVKKLYGNCNFQVTSIEDEERVATLTGNMKKRCKVRENDLVLMEPMGDGDNCKYLIIFRYTQDQKKILEKEGRLKKVETEKEEVQEELFMFQGDEEKVANETKEVDEFFVDDI